MNFPDSPSNGDTVTLNSKEYAYSSANSTWLPASEAVSASTVLSDTAPVSPSAGDTWYNTDDGTMNVYYNDGSSSQWVGTSGPAGPVGPAGAAGSDASAGNSTTFVADTAALIALSSMSAGDQALVIDNNKLFIYTGSAWYLIATMVNASPTPISGVAPAYTLEKDGTATTITAVSTDPEGFPLTWSYAVTTGSLGSTATVSQADNVFTITPSADSADKGEFSITFSATDGGNTGVVNAISAFTLSFATIDPNFNQVSLQSTFEGTNNGVNNVFTDSSAYPNTITASGTASGNVTQGSFSPFSRPDGEWSVAFDGTADFIEGPSVDLLGSGAFTFECWVNVPYKTTDATFTDAFLAQYQSNGNLIFGTKYNVVRVWMGGAEVLIGTTAIVGNGWHHIAITRNASNSVRLFVDGVADGPAFTNSTDFSLNLENFEIGSWNAGGNSAINGNISNLRVVKGTAVYDPSASTITVPSSSLTAITNTSLLTCQSNRFIDNSTNAHALTPSNQTAVSSFGPFLTTSAYDPAVNGASAYFDGTGDYLTTPYAASITEWYNADYTIETWVYYTAFTESGASPGHPNVLKHGEIGSAGDYWSFGAIANGTLKFYYFNGSSIDTCVSTATLSLNTWHHIAMCHDDSDNEINLYLDGVSVKTHTVAGTPQSSPSLPFIMIIGEADSVYFTGYMSDFRVTHGTEVYTSNFTPPTAPLTAITNTKLLLNMADGQAIDDTAQNNMTVHGTSKISTSHQKLGTSSLYFDGTANTSYVIIPHSTDNTIDGDKNWTVEFYWRADNVSNPIEEILSKGVGLQITGQSGAIGLTLGVGGSYFINTTGGTVVNNTWYHIAVVKNGTNYTLYLNGISTITATHASTVDTVGGDWVLGNVNAEGSGYAYPAKGYMDGLRVSQFARYTTTFTPPTDVSDSANAIGTIGQ